MALWLVRHGETTTNERGLITGTVEAPLTERGREQARTAAHALAGRTFDFGWSSTLRRSRETLEEMLAAHAFEIRHVTDDERLNERSLGDLELTPTRPIEAFARGDLDFAPGGGEPYAEVARRCLSFLLDVAALARSADRELELLVCTHVGPMRILAGIAENLSDPVEVLALHYSNSAPVRFDLESLRWPAFLEGRGRTLAGAVA